MFQTQLKPIVTAELWSLTGNKSIGSVPLKVAVHTKGLSTAAMQDLHVTYCQPVKNKHGLISVSLSAHSVLLKYSLYWVLLKTSGNGHVSAAEGQIPQSSLTSAFE